MNKILLLGGSYSQIPAIKEAKSRGLYTILCDYLPDNPGREFADEYHNISTTDIEAVLTLSKKRDIDHIFAYVSDPAVLTAACVAKQLGLRGNSPESVKLLSYKDRFRNFMRDNGFNIPKFIVIDRSELELHDPDVENLEFPLIVKPVDSSDTKGVFKVNSQDEFIKYAKQSLAYSRCDKIIAEEYVDCETANFHGDAFVVDGEMKFCMLGDNLFFSESNPLKPVAENYPSRQPKDLVQAVESEVDKLISASGYENGAVNIEARVNSKREIFIMEIGPRSGGGYTPQSIFHSTGFDMLKASFDYLQGLEILNQKNENILPVIVFDLHSNEDGIISRIEFNKTIVKYLVEKHLHVKPGETVKSFRQPNSTIGTIILKFNNFDEMSALTDNLYDVIMSGIEIKN